MTLVHCPFITMGRWVYFVSLTHHPAAAVIQVMVRKEGLNQGQLVLALDT